MARKYFGLRAMLMIALKVISPSIFGMVALCKTHQVITGVCLMTRHLQRTFSATTQVTFRVLTEDEIEFYVEKFRPLDKAGAYGVQEWIGFVGVSRLEGSYFNVMGLPVQRLYQELKKL